MLVGIGQKSLWFALRAMTVIVIAIMGSGCAYLKNRGNDFVDCLQFGITVTDKVEPDFAVFYDFFSLVPTGYASVGGKILGFGGRQVGWLDHEDHTWGVVAWGSEKDGIGVFDPKDPHQARPDQANETSRPRFCTGFVRVWKSENKPPMMRFFMCHRALHLGWLGIYNRMSPVDIIDFTLGWAQLDIVGDDVFREEK